MHRRGPTAQRSALGASAESCKRGVSGEAGSAPSGPQCTRASLSRRRRHPSRRATRTRGGCSRARPGRCKPTRARSCHPSEPRGARNSERSLNSHQRTGLVMRAAFSVERRPGSTVPECPVAHRRSRLDLGALLREILADLWVALPAHQMKKFARSRPEHGITRRGPLFKLLQRRTARLARGPVEGGSPVLAPAV